MKYLPMEANVVLIDGPVAVYIHDADEQTILNAYERLGRLLRIAASSLNQHPTKEVGAPDDTFPPTRSANWSLSGGNHDSGGSPRRKRD